MPEWGSAPGTGLPWDGGFRDAAKGSLGDVKEKALDMGGGDTAVQGSGRSLAIEGVEKEGKAHVPGRG